MRNKRTNLISYDFIDLLEEPNYKKLSKSIDDEIYNDCVIIKDLTTVEENEEMLFGYLVNYISKYSYLIYHFEKMAMYEKCAEINKNFKTIMTQYFGVTDEFLSELITDSIESYRIKKI